MRQPVLVKGNGNKLRGKIQAAALIKFARRFGAKMIILFGSALDMRKTPQDVDVALVLPPQKSEEYERGMGKYTKLWVALGEALGVSPDRLDITFISHKTTPLLLYQIAVKGRLLFGNQREFVKLKLYAVKQYWDTAYFRTLRDRLIKKRLKSYVG